MVRSPTPLIRASPNAFSCEGPTRGAPSRRAVATSVMMVNVELAVPFAAGVTLIGLNEQVVNCGKPEQEKLTAWLKPFAEVAVTVAVPDAPCATVSDVGLSAIEKLGAPVTVCVRALETEAV